MSNSSKSLNLKNDPQASHSNRRQIFHVACLVAACLNVTSCYDPKDKPIPPLKPAAGKDETSEVLTATAITPGTVTRMPLGTLYQLHQSKAALIFDVRPLIFYKMGHIDGAISFPKADFDKSIDKQETLIKNAIKNQIPVVLYCTDLACPDAITVATRLSERGHSVSVLQGGYEAWKAATE
ncbi:MAG: rhodanese-like domain-containing protein [Akkermansiaceae bacterium]|jgi:rhodanese-related sulfurtransferase